MRREFTPPSTGNLERLVEYQKERRKSRRFALKQPATLRHSVVPHDAISHELNGETENASLHGVLVRAPSAIADASEVEVELHLRKVGRQSVLLRGAGRVVRSELKLTGEFGIAVAFNPPLTEKSHAPGHQAPGPRTVRNPKVR
jgi:hypothetical protein